MEDAKRIKFIEFFNKHVFVESNKILPSDDGAIIMTKQMAENISRNVALERPFRFEFPNSAAWFKKRISEIRAKYPDECKYNDSKFERSILLEELEPMFLASDVVSRMEKDSYLKAKGIILAYETLEL